MPVINSLKSSRTREKKALLKEETEAEKLIQADLSDQPRELTQFLLAVGKVLINLETKLARLESVNEKLAEAYEKTGDTEAIEQYQTTLDEETELTESVITKISELKVLKEETEKRRKELEVAATPGLEQRVAQVQEQVDNLQASQPTTNVARIWSPAVQGSIKPPQLEIATFSGDVLRWQEFWDTFEAAVHNANYSPVDKLNYLKSKLAGEALEAVSGYQLSNSNYDVVIDVLKTRFGNRQMIIDAHYRNLAHLPAATHHTGRLRQCYDTMERHLRSLEALGENIEHRHFVALITEKLPQRVLYQLFMLKGEGDWTVAKLRELLGKHIRAMEMTGGNHSSLPVPPSNRQAQNSRESHTHNRPHSTAGELLAGSGGTGPPTRQQSTPKCVFCTQAHWSDECPKHTTLQSRMEKLKGSCFKCLQKGHVMKDCRKQRICAHCGKTNHHRSLCPKLFTNTEGRTGTQEVQNISTQSSSDTTEGVIVTCGSQVLMQTAIATIKNTSSNASTSTRLILDSGSQRTYITERLAKDLQLVLHSPEKLTVATFGSNKPKHIKYRPAELQLVLRDGSMTTLKVSVVPHITGKVNRAPLTSEDAAFLKNEGWESKLADSLPNEPESTSIEMLIGNDYYFDLLLPRKMELGGGLSLFHSKLGWIIGGRYPTDANAVNEPNLLASTIGFIPTNIKASTHMLSNIDLALTKPDLDIFWNLESIGIMDSPVTSDNDKALENFNNTVQFADGRYSVTWPWRESSPPLPENYQLAMGRLKSTLQRLKKDPRLLEKYTAIIQEQLERRIIERISNETEKGVLKHYIPHHAVITPTKTTTKVRVVYDASAKTKQSNVSLNECLYRGPVMLPDLCGLLLRFRCHPIAIIADVEKAFLNIGLQIQDRDVTRFLWLKDPKNPNPDGNLQIYRFCRIPFGVISSPFLLAATISYHLKKADTHTAERILRDIYVDNVVTGVANLYEAKNFYTDSKALFASATMNLREWGSNSRELLSFMTEQDRATGPIYKVLGITWNSSEDTLAVSGPLHNKEKETFTKREVLQAIASIFDPLGYYSPTILKAKLFMQGLWQKRLDWDATLDDEKLCEWIDILEDLKTIPQYKLPRYLGLSSQDQCSAKIDLKLICFCDASAKAYAAVVYLLQSSSDSYKADLVFSKTRLASANITIPRLELLGVLIGIRALKFVQKEICLPVVNKVLWTDSQCVLHWIQTTKPLPVFVSNRLKEIKALSGVCFKYVPTEDNPADMATRGKTPSELSSSIWWKGPQWLQKHERDWPEWESPVQSTDTDTEGKTNNVLFEAKLVVVEGSHAEKQDKSVIGDLIKVEKFATLLKLIRVTAWLIRGINRFMKRSCEKGALTAQELQKAKLLWDLHIQKKHYNQVIQETKQGKRNNLSDQLNLQLDECGLLRCHGRYDFANLSQATKYPKLLPQGEYYTNLVIRDYHKRVFHAGVSQTLAQIRMEYWIPKGRSQVKRELNKCRICRRVEGHAYRMPKMPPWPKQRVTEAFPFQYTGLDYFGPLYIKYFNSTSEKPSYKKVWVCLFTCMVVRAIHLELVEDMSTDQFLMCLRRFISRRGIPHQIISDNAKQFKLAKRVINKVQEQPVNECEEVNNYLSRKGIQWKLIVELAPWMGGFYERLVGLTKRALRKTIGKISLTEKQLVTVLTEVEVVINSRPLIYVGDDVNQGHVLTPGDFLSTNSNHIIPGSCCDEDSQEVEYIEGNISSADKLLDIWKQGQKNLNRFWQSWRNDYLLSLRERTGMSLKQGKKHSSKIPQVGDIVLIKEELPRGRWKVGRIHELVKGRDQFVRSAKVLISPNKFLCRALNLLYPIECPKDKKVTWDQAEMPNQDGLLTSSSGSESDASHKEDDSTVPVARRPVRQATLAARQKLKEWLNPVQNSISLGSVAIFASDII